MIAPSGEARLAGAGLLAVRRRTDVTAAPARRAAPAASDRLSRLPSRGLVGWVVVVEKVHSFGAFRHQQYDPCLGCDGRPAV